MRLARGPLRRALAVGVASALLLGVAIWLTLASQADRDRYTVSDVVTVVSVDDAAGAFWIRQHKHREIWISTDGSGRIRETVTSVEVLDPAQQQRWNAMASGDPGQHDTPLPAGGLVYLTDAAIADGLTAIAQHGAGGDAIRAIASLLAETAPAPATVEEARRIAEGLPGVTSSQEGDLVTFAGVSAIQGGTRIEIVLDLAHDTFVRERWYALSPQPGLQDAVPTLMFDRLVLTTTRKQT